MTERSETRRLTLLRHAKAEQDGPSDHERELAVSGRGQCTQVADHLVASGRVPELVLCSTATRTQQTWELVAGRLGERAAATTVRYVDALYLGDVADILDAIAAAPSDAVDVLVVGHEPGMSETAYHLAGEGSDTAAVALVRVGVPTASLSALSTREPWSQLTRGGSTLDAVLTSPHS